MGVFLSTPLFLFFKNFIYLFKSNGEGGRKKGKETSMCKRYIDWLPHECSQMGTWPATQACALTRNQTSDPLVHRPVFSPLSRTSQGRFVFLRRENSNLFLVLKGRALGLRPPPQRQQHLLSAQTSARPSCL